MPQELSHEIWQINMWNRGELLFRHLNNIILEDPDKLLDKDNLKDIRNLEALENFNYVIIVRKGDTFSALNNFNSEAGSTFVEMINQVDTIKMPAFGDVTYTLNTELLEKTGYSILKQYDFYFSDNEEGSLLFLSKVVNLSGAIGKFLFNYFSIIFVVFLIGVGGLSLISTYKFSRKLEEIIYATEEISQENFDVVIDDCGDTPFSVMGRYINQMTQRLSKAKQYRIEVEQARMSFIDAMTHDLKTPLTAIKVQVEALKDGVVSDPDKVQRYFKNIEKKVNNIDQMLNELKVFSQLVTGEEHYDFEQVHLYDYTRDIVDEWLFDVTPDCIRISIEKAPSVKDLVSIDVLKFKRLLLNIFENTMKYANKEDIHLRIVFENQNDNVILKIIDNGPGVDTCNLNKLFDQYYRVDDARNQSVAGSGLGLAICKAIIDSHQGTISAFNVVPEGLGILIKLKGEPCAKES
jgi:histidine kinase